ncbi:hypothetical protein GGR56DRAFT_693078 [Xylariaceae sp. FL0804]|nr:hypothetical protein GGR56DRAFT_693078 [Xylariaceae sp. FL0804]
MLATQIDGDMIRWTPRAGPPPSYFRFAFPREAAQRRRRTLIVLGCNFFLQGTGQQFSSTYRTAPSSSRSSAAFNPFYYRVTSALLGIASNALTAYLSDRVGRRRILFVGAAAQLCGLQTMGALGTVPLRPHQGARSVKRGIVAGMMLADQGYLQRRVGGGTVLAVALQAAVTLALPYALDAAPAKLGARVAFVFASRHGRLARLRVRVRVPDCRGRALEDLDRLFAQTRVPPRRFHRVAAARALPPPPPDDDDPAVEEDARVTESEFDCKVDDKAGAAARVEVSQA